MPALRYKHVETEGAVTAARVTPKPIKGEVYAKEAEPETFAAKMARHKKAKSAVKKDGAHYEEIAARVGDDSEDDE